MQHIYICRNAKGFRITINQHYGIYGIMAELQIKIYLQIIFVIKKKISPIKVFHS